MSTSIPPTPGSGAPPSEVQLPPMNGMGPPPPLGMGSLLGGMGPPPGMPPHLAGLPPMGMMPPPGMGMMPPPGMGMMPPPGMGMMPPPGMGMMPPPGMGMMPPPGGPGAMMPPPAHNLMMLMGMGPPPLGSGGMPHHHQQHHHHHHPGAAPQMPQMLPMKAQKVFFPQEVQVYFKERTVHHVKSKPMPKCRKIDPITSHGTWEDILSKFERGPPPAREKTETPKEVLLRQRKEKRINLRESIRKATNVWNPFADTQQQGETVTTDPYKTLVVTNISYNVNEVKLKEHFKVYGPIKNCRIIRNLNQKHRGYGFIEYERKNDFVNAYKNGHEKKIDGRRVNIDIERGRTILKFRPRRFGGGIGLTRQRVGRSPSPIDEEELEVEAIKQDDHEDWSDDEKEKKHRSFSPNHVKLSPSDAKNNRSRSRSAGAKRTSRQSSPTAGGAKNNAQVKIEGRSRSRSPRQSKRSPQRRGGSRSPRGGKGGAERSELKITREGRDIGGANNNGGDRDRDRDRKQRQRSSRIDGDEEGELEYNGGSSAAAVATAVTEEGEFLNGANNPSTSGINSNGGNNYSGGYNRSPSAEDRDRKRKKDDKKDKKRDDRSKDKTSKKDKDKKSKRDH